MQRTSQGMLRPIESMAVMTSSSGMIASKFDSAMLAQLTALLAPSTLRPRQGTSTRLATGSQISPSMFCKAIEAAAKEGSSTIFVNGIDPGFANDLLPLALAGTCQSVQQIRCMEIINYDTYDSAPVMFDVMGFGGSLDETPMLLQPGVLSLAWGSVVRQLAAGLGIELDEVTETHVRVPAPEDFDIAAGPIGKGTTAAIRFEVRGMKDGNVAVVLEHVTRLRDDLGEIVDSVFVCDGGEGDKPNINGRVIRPDAEIRSADGRFVPPGFARLADSDDGTRRYRVLKFSPVPPPGATPGKPNAPATGENPAGEGEPTSP